MNDNKNIVETIMNSCEELKLIEAAKNTSNKSSEGCGPILYQLSILMADIEENDNNWFSKDTRVKRNIVSQLFLDDWPEDQLSFSEEFKNMSAHGSLSSTEAVKQTTFISSTLNSGGKLGEINSRSINDYVASQLSFVSSTLSAARNGSVNVMRLFQLRTTVQDIISYQMLMLNRFSSKQKQYMNIMPRVGEKNSQTPNLLPSDTLISELNKIRNIVSEKGLDLPMKLTSENLFFLYQISSSEIVRLNDQIFVILQVPLISKYSGNHFSLLKVTSSLYNIEDNLYSFVVPNHEFIAIDAYKEHYTTLTLEDLNNCHEINNNASIICKQTSPVMSTSTSSECEISILLKGDFPMDQATNCNSRYIRNNAEIFIKVLKPNSWLVTMPKSTKIRYICEGETTQELFIQINGLLTIDPNCKFATNNVLMTGHNFFPKNKIYAHPNFNFSKKFEEQREISSKILSKIHFWRSEYYFYNDIPQVVNFGDKEKLLRISYGGDVANFMILVKKMIDNSEFLTLTVLVVVVAVKILLFAILMNIISHKKRGQQINRPSAPYV